MEIRHKLIQVKKECRRHLRYMGKMFKFTLIRDIQYRSNFFGFFFLTVVWFIQLYFLTFVITNRYGSIAGWSQEEIFILSSTWGFTNGLLTFLFLGLFSLPISINTGGLDYILLKPINSIIAASTNLFGIHNLIIAFCYLILILVITPFNQVSPAAIAGFAAACFISILLQYSIWLIIVTTTFHSGRLNGTFDLFSILRIPGKYPFKAFSTISPVIRILMLPLITFASVPASFLIGKFQILQGAYFLISAAIMGFSAVIFWNFSIKKYTGASS